MFNPFKKNDPLLEAARGVIETNYKRRAAEDALHEALGISQKKGLPCEAHADYDKTLKEVTDNVLAGKTVEEAVELAELSKGLLKKYIRGATEDKKKANDDSNVAADKALASRKKSTEDKYRNDFVKNTDRYYKRKAGLSVASSKVNGTPQDGNWKAKVPAVNEDMGLLTTNKPVIPNEKERAATRGAMPNAKVASPDGVPDKPKIKPLQELSKKTLKSYIKKATTSADRAWAKSDKEEDKSMSTDGNKYPEKQARHQANAIKASNTWVKRNKGVSVANQKLGPGGKYSDVPAVKVLASNIKKKVNEAALNGIREEIAANLWKQYEPLDEDARQDWVNALSDENLDIVNEGFGDWVKAGIAKTRKALGFEKTEAPAKAATASAEAPVAKRTDGSAKSIGAANSGANDTATAVTSGERDYNKPYKAKASASADASSAAKPAEKPADRPSTGWEAAKKAYSTVSNALDTKASRLGGGKQASKPSGSTPPNEPDAHGSGGQETPNKADTNVSAAKQQDAAAEPKKGASSTSNLAAVAKRANQTADFTKVNGNVGGKGGTAGAVGADNASDYVSPQKNPYRGAVGKKADAMSQHDNKDMYEEAKPRFNSIEATYRQMMTEGKKDVS